MMELQPIETAPKDGTWVLLFGGFADDCSSQERAQEDEMRHPVVAFWHGSQQAWAFAKADGWWLTYDLPTHWLSLDALPTPPIESRDEANQKAARAAWQMNTNCTFGFLGDPITDEEADRLRKMRDWTPPRTADDKIH